jgi:hypothetical protein
VAGLLSYSFPSCGCSYKKWHLDFRPSSNSHPNAFDFSPDYEFVASLAGAEELPTTTRSARQSLNPISFGPCASILLG